MENGPRGSEVLEVPGGSGRREGSGAPPLGSDALTYSEGGLGSTHLTVYKQGIQDQRAEC